MFQILIGREDAAAAGARPKRLALTRAARHNAGTRALLLRAALAIDVAIRAAIDIVEATRAGRGRA